MQETTRLDFVSLLVETKSPDTFLEELEELCRAHSNKGEHFYFEYRSKNFREELVDEGTIGARPNLEHGLHVNRIIRRKAPEADRGREVQTERGA